MSLFQGCHRQYILEVDAHTFEHGCFNSMMNQTHFHPFKSVPFDDKTRKIRAGKNILHIVETICSMLEPRMRVSGIAW